MLKIAKIPAFWLVIIVFIIPLVSSCGVSEQSSIQLRIYNADSLILPFQVMGKQFESKNPGIEVLIEGHGSVQVIRAVTELQEEVDVAAVADSQLIPLLMYDAPMPDKNGPYADWCIDFAGNSLGIAYTGKSRYSTELNPDNWYQVLSRKDVRIGLADPRIDSLGYRALMMLQLSGDYYHDDALMEKMIGNGSATGLNVGSSNGIVTMVVPEVWKPISDRVVLRTYSLQVLALLESGDVDYSFEYESVARQHGLDFLQLPAAINLSSADYDKAYRQVRVKMEYQRFATVNPEFRGAQIIYGVTIPNSAPHPREAEKFLEFLLGPDGQDILKRNYQPPLSAARCDNIERAPYGLRRYLP